MKEVTSTIATKAYSYWASILWILTFLRISVVYSALNMASLCQDPYEYTRSGNPTRKVLEACLAASEGAKYGNW